MGYAPASPAVWPLCRSEVALESWRVVGERRRGETYSSNTGPPTACISSAMWRLEEMTVRSTDPSATTQFIASELQPRSASGAMRELGTHLPLPPHVSVAGDVLC